MKFCSFAYLKDFFFVTILQTFRSKILSSQNLVVIDPLLEWINLNFENYYIL